MKKLFLKLHLWLSVPFGIVVFLVCFSGAMLVFEKEVTELVQRGLYRVEPPAPGAQPLPMDELARRVEAGLPGGETVKGIAVLPGQGYAYQVTLSSSGRDFLLVDPYTGVVQGKSERPAFFLFMFRLHRWLLDSRPAGDDGGVFWGKLVVGVSTLLFVVVLITGVVIWWPRTLKGLKNGLKIFFSQGKFRFWHSLHVAGGMYALLFLLLMALTGLTWSFSWYRNGFYALFGAEVSQGSGHGASSPGGRDAARGNQGAARGGREAGQGGREASHRHAGTDFSHWQDVYERLAAERPDYVKIQVLDGTAVVSSNRWGNTRASDRYRFDPRSGEVLGATLYRDGEKASKMRGWIYSLHVGSWGGMLTRVLAFLAALLGASLPLTGYYLWIRRLYKRKGKGKA